MEEGRKIYQPGTECRVENGFIMVNDDRYLIRHVNSVKLGEESNSVVLLGCLVILGILLLIGAVLIYPPIMFFNRIIGFGHAFGDDTDTVFYGLVLGLAVIFIIVYSGLQFFRIRFVEWQMSSGEKISVCFWSSVGVSDLLEKIHAAMDHQLTESVSLAEELSRLVELKNEGVLDDGEFVRVKKFYLKLTDCEKEKTVKLLKSLYELYGRGVLSQSEFNMKKWDLLSRQ